MRKTITGTGGMLLLQTLKDAGVEYLFTNPGSAEDRDLRRHRRGRRSAPGGRQARGGWWRRWRTAIHRISGKVGVVIART